MTFEHDEPLVGEVAELRVSPDRLRVARPVPEEMARDNRTWLSVYFMDGVGLTVALLTDEEVVAWQTVWRSRPTTGD